MNSVSRRTRVATLIAAGVIGFGGVAAAGSGGFDVLSDGSDEVEMTDEVEEVATTVSSTIVEEVTTTTVEEDLDEEVETQQGVIEKSSDEGDDKSEQPTVDEVDLLPGNRDNPHTTFDENDCVTDDKGNELNHGKTVSAVARGDAGFEGVEVRDAAQSDCGKAGRGTDEDDIDKDEQNEEFEAEEATEEVDAEPEKSKPDVAKSKEAKGKSNGNGNSNGNGKSNGKKSND